MNTTNGANPKPSLNSIKELLEVLPIGVVLVDEQGCICAINAAAERMFGYTREELLGKALEILLPEAQRDQHQAYREQYFQSPSTRLMGPGSEFIAKRKNGSLLPLQIGLSPLQTRRGMYVFASVTDISERKAMEDSLRKSEEWLRLAYEAADLGTWQYDIGEDIFHFDERSRMHHGFDKADVTLEDYYACVHPDDIARLRQEIAATRDPTGDGRRITEIRVIHPDGTMRWLSQRAHVYFEQKGDARRPILTIGTSQDITGRKQAEETLKESFLRLQMAARAGNVGLWDWDLRTNQVFYSPEWKRQIGYEDHEIPNNFMAWLDRVHPDDVERSTKIINTYIEKPWPDYHQEFRFRHKDGGYRWILAQASLLFDNDGNPVRMLGAHLDITERRQAEDKIRRLNRLYAMLRDVNALIVRERDRQELFNESCHIAVETGGFGMAWMDAVGSETLVLVPMAWAGSDSEKFSTTKTTKDRLSQAEGAIGRILREKKPVLVNDLGADRAHGISKERRQEAYRLGYRSMISLPIMTEDKLVGIFTLFAKETDFFTQEEVRHLADMAGNISFALDYLNKTEKLDYLAYYDALTGLPNRILLNDYLGRAVRRAERETAQMAVLMFDINRFRNVNETLGQYAGDTLLRKFTQRLQEVWPESDNLARMEADRFAGIIENIKDSSEIADLVKKPLTDAMSMPFEVDGQELRVAVTTGIALFPEDGKDADTLLKNADAALKNAKTSGHRYLFYRPQMNAALGDILSLENKLRKAIEHEQFLLHYQPKINLVNRQISGFEALIRWNDPETGLIPPYKFIPLLEETGLILEVGAWAIRKALEDYHTLYIQGLQPQHIAVNVSPIQLRQPDFVDVVSQTIKHSKASPHGLDLEITESLIMDDIEGNIKKLKAIHELGVNIAIDDFGTGYSSLAYLARLPVDLLKIDRSFILAMTEDADSMTIVSTIISLAHSLNLKVIAEGVETEEQARFLRLLRCDEIQGYVFSKPIPLDQVISLIEEHSAR